MTLRRSPGTSPQQCDLFPEHLPRAGTPETRRGSRRPGNEPGWHGLVPARLEVDWSLVAQLTPDLTATMVLVEKGSPARRAGLRRGDYVVSIAPSGTGQTSLKEFDALRLPAQTPVWVTFHRPFRGLRSRDLLKAVLVLGRRPGPPKLKRWQDRWPRTECGMPVTPQDRKRFLAAMSAHHQLTHLGHRLLTRMLHHYEGPLGICPSYRTLAHDMGVRRRATIMEQLRRLHWLGLLEIDKGAGLKRPAGATNQYRITWPAGWNVVSFGATAAQSQRLGEA